MNYRPILISEHPKIPREIFDIIQYSLSSVDPEQALLRNLCREEQKLLVNHTLELDLAEIENIYVVGAGKGVAGMVRGLNRIVGDRISGGIVISKHLFSDKNLIGNVEITLGNHPVPGEDSYHSTRKLAKFTKKIAERDLVICLITGGGSSLMTLPADGLSLSDIQMTTSLLLGCGATINEINVIRKHLDMIKGGGLAKLLYPAEVVSLILSDVVGNPLDIIASGPTAADESTFVEAWDILRYYEITQHVPDAVKKHLQKGIDGGTPETLKYGSHYLERVSNFIVGDNLMVCQAAVQRGIELGFNPVLLTTSLQGEARNAGTYLAGIIKDTAMRVDPDQKPTCIIAGGETTVKVYGNGRGGRNQELALAAVKTLAGIPRVALITLATDGEDGPTDAAGAIVTGATYQKGQELSMDPDSYLANNDSYNYFMKLGDSLITGPTGTNVNDICFMFSW